MLTSLIVTFCAICSTQATSLSQKINNLHLHAKFGEDLPEFNPQIYPQMADFALVDKHVSHVAEKFLKEQMPKPHSLQKAMYGPIQDVVIPGVKLPLPINLKNIDITGLKSLRLDGLQWRFKPNRVEFNVTIPYLFIDVTFDKTVIELDEHFDNEVINTDIRLSVRLLDLDMFASVRYNIAVFPDDQDFFIDKADVDINIREALFELNIIYGLEEIRYVLAEIINNPLDDIMDAVLKVVVREINKELLAKVDPADIGRYLVSKLPRNSKVPKNLIVIARA